MIEICNISSKIVFSLISASNLNKIKPKKTVIYLSLIVVLGLAMRFYYVPTDLPIVSDGFFQFVYAAKTVFEGSLPIGYNTTNTGWANFLSLFFGLSDTSDPFYLMQIQRSLSIILSTITIIPAFFIFRKFVNVRWALFGSILLVIEPRLLMISLEGINYSLFIFIFVLAIALFLKKTNISLFLSFGCIACATLVRYEGLLLLIPLSIMYFVKFNDKKSIIKFLGMIFIIIIILAPMSVLRMQATENICYESVFGVRCGDDGFTHAILAGPRFLSQTLTVMPSQETPETTTPMIDENKDKTDSYAALSENKIISWYQGRMEIGPRALGNRSIIANPALHNVKELLNSRVKFRESFRPFAPSILAEDVKDWFEYDHPAPFMLFVFKIKKEKREKIPGVTHVDGTGRLQAVNKEFNERYYNLINEFKKITGIPMVINTSFNIMGNPIVESPTDAIKCFLGNGIDYLVLGDYLIKKESH